MADNPTTFPVLTANGPPAIQMDALLDSSGNYIPQSVPRVRAAPVSDTNPMPVNVVETAVGGVSTVSTSALANSLEIMASTGVLYGVTLWAEQSGWFMLFDVAAGNAPADGTVSPRKAWQFISSMNETLSPPFPPMAMTNGATLVFSSTGPVNKTTPESGQAFMTGDV